MFHLFLVIQAYCAASLFANDAVLDGQGKTQYWPAGKPVREVTLPKTRTLRMPFIANNGQANEQVRFYAKTFGGTVFVTKAGEIVYALPGSDRNTLNPSNKAPRSVVIKETMVGAKIGGITGEQPAVTTVNYFTGNDKSKWKSRVPTYTMVNLGEIYKGVELGLKAYGDNVEKLFCVKPGASPEFIKIRLDGGKSLRINQDGQLEVDTELGLVQFTKPIAYQETEGKRVEVRAEYSIEIVGNDGTEGGGEHKTQNPQREIPGSKHTYSFKVAAYDKTKDLIIDPLLAATYLGGNGFDAANALSTDAEGNVYVAGRAGSSEFPSTSGAYDTGYGDGGSDAFIAKLDSGLANLLASTFLGGSGWDGCIDIALDPGGNVYVTGYTESDNFPTPSGRYTSYNGGTSDVFVSKLDSGLSILHNSTYLGGDSQDASYSIAIDAKGNVYVAGYTWSENFPTTAGAYSKGIGLQDAYVSKFNSSLTTLLASTRLGGEKEDEAHYLCIDKSGNVYVTGYTLSSDFPTPSGFDRSFDGNYEAFVSKFNNGLTSLRASTYLGGIYGDFGIFVATDTKGDVYVTGSTYSPSLYHDLPGTDKMLNLYDDGGGNNSDAFVAKFKGNLASLKAFTYLGGEGDDNGHSIAVNSSGVHVSGSTASTGFPTTDNAYTKVYSGGSSDVFVSQFNSSLTSLANATFLGGDGTDGRINWTGNGTDLQTDSAGNVYVTGWTSSSNFPTTSGAYKTSYNGGEYDVFISKLDGKLFNDCVFSISPSGKSFSADSGAGSVGVTAGSGCSWTATSGAAWITIPAGSSGTGDGTVNYSVAANTGTSQRKGSMTIAGKTFKVKQKGILVPSE